jgi:hypothetical protein
MAKKRPQNFTKKVQKQIIESFTFPKVFDKNTGKIKAKELGFSSEFSRNIKTKDQLEGAFNVREAFRSPKVAEFFYKETYGRGSRKSLSTEKNSRSEFNNFVEDLSSFWGLTKNEKAILKRDVEAKGLTLSDFESKSIRNEILEDVLLNNNTAGRLEFYKKIYNPIAIANLRGDDLDPIIAGLSRSEKVFLNKTNKLHDTYMTEALKIDPDTADKEGWVYASLVMVEGKTHEEAIAHIKAIHLKSSVLPEKIRYLK